VKLIDANGAFIRGAFAGIGYNTVSDLGSGEAFSCMYFPLDVFITLANQGFPMGATYNELSQLSRLYPRGPRDYPPAAFCGEPFFRTYQRVWNGWETEIEFFLGSLYPEGKSIFDGLEHLRNNRPVWTKDEFKSHSKVALRKRKNIEHIDTMVGNYNEFREELIRRINQGPGRNLDDIVRRMWQLREGALLLGFEAQQAWARLQHIEHRRRLQALETLAEQCAAEVSALPDRSVLAKTGKYKAA
jgi:hypothetical protein